MTSALADSRAADFAHGIEAANLAALKDRNFRQAIEACMKVLPPVVPSVGAAASERVRQAVVAAAEEFRLRPATVEFRQLVAAQADAREHRANLQRELDSADQQALAAARKGQSTQGLRDACGELRRRLADADADLQAISDGLARANQQQRAAWETALEGVRAQLLADAVAGKAELQAKLLDVLPGLVWTWLEERQVHSLAGSRAFGSEWATPPV